tara:strand:- start:1224 stop:1532 length:309 start_codon:yes stop_codon:yes gene_type:complete
MSRKSGDTNYQNYVGYQSFSSDMPVHQINDTNWYLKIENKIPAFFINAENVFKQMPPECFLLTAEKTTSMNMSNWQNQCEDYFGLTMDKIKCLILKNEDQKK